jgi:hypothetical protein
MPLTFVKSLNLHAAATAKLVVASRVELHPKPSRTSSDSQRHLLFSLLAVFGFGYVTLVFLVTLRNVVARLELVYSVIS